MAIPPLLSPFITLNWARAFAQGGQNDAKPNSAGERGERVAMCIFVSEIQDEKFEFQKKMSFSMFPYFCVSEFYFKTRILNGLVVSG